jgi:hypothetical protein
LPVLFAKDRREVGFPVLPAVAKGNYVIDVPRLTRPDLAARDVADATVAIEDPDAHTRRYRGVGRRTNPFSD